MKFLRTLLSRIWRFINGVRIVILNVIFFVLLLVTIAVLSSGEEVTEIPEGGLLVLNPAGILVEEETYVSPFDQFFQEAFNTAPEIPEANIYALISSIEAAAEDERIAGLVLDLRYLQGGGLSKLELLGEHLNRFRDETDKPIIAVGDYYTQNQYYLASHADTIYMNPMGGVMMDGFHYYQMYFKSMLEKLKVNQHVFRVGSYKSAVEPFMRNDMSDEARIANEAWLNELWTHYLNGVQRNRDLPDEIVSGKLEDYMRLLEQAGNDQAQLALNAGMVDELRVRNGMRDALIDIAGLDTDTNTYRHIAYQDYQQSLNAEKRPTAVDEDKDRVAVIVGRGPIMDGSRRAGEIGSDSMAKELRDARLDDDVKAVVVRIDSPGGSAFASEVIRQELLHLREAGKPVIASMSSTAASGGYWIAAGADEIIAAPTTITGSIGVFGLFVTIEDSLDYLGINSDGLSTTELPYITVNRELHPAAGELIQNSIDEIYAKFLQLVADSRDMTVEQVHEVAQGRVWTGQAALQHGLVDGLGEIDEAIQLAAQRAGLAEDEFEVSWPERELSPGEQIMRDLFGSALAWLPLDDQMSTPSGAAEQSLLKLWQEVQVLNQFNDPEGVYIRCLECKTD
jgi:protease-4